MAAVPSGPSLDSTPHYAQIKKKFQPTALTPEVAQRYVLYGIWEKVFCMIYRVNFVAFNTQTLVKNRMALAI
jgi:hypothetical protein